MRQGPLTVLISEPQLKEMGVPFLPTMWGILKSYWEKCAGDPRPVNWLPPIYRMAEPAVLLDAYSARIDVLGLSCYTWNWRVQCQIAEIVKLDNPECLVVIGGPEPDYSDPEFFLKHPYIDAVVIKDGEIPFCRILSIMLDNAGRETMPDRLDLFLGVPGLCLRTASGKNRVLTGRAVVPTKFDYSPYIEQSEFYEGLIGSIGNMVIATWETNRGCPYSCSYCDWGSNTMAKLRVFDMERVRAEIEWFSRHRIGFLMLADANFGILPRDLEIADLLARANATSGFPSYLAYNTAKNNPDRTVAIARKVVGSGLAASHVLSIQHTDPDVLAATDRGNISTAKQIEVVRSLMHDNISIYVQLILGIPGDNEHRWRQCFADLMEWGIHAYYIIFAYHLLPNAPAAAPEYLARWRAETIERYTLLNIGVRDPKLLNPALRSTARLIVATSSYDRSNWVEMQIYGTLVKALHCGALTHAIAIYLRFTHGVSYRSFYDALIDEFFDEVPDAVEIRDALRKHYFHYLQDEDAVDFMTLSELPELEEQVEPSRWAYVMICRHLPALLPALADFLIARHPGTEALHDLLDYQASIVVLPDYDARRGKSFSVRYDWPAYFAASGRLVTPSSPLPEPDRVDAVVTAADESWCEERATMPFRWNDIADEPGRWKCWFNIMVVGRTSPMKNNLNRLTLTPVDRVAEPESALTSRPARAHA